MRAGLALATLLVLAGCASSPQFYASPPINPDLPAATNVPAFSVLLTKDASPDIFQATRIPRPADGEPRDMDVEILVTQRVGEIGDEINFWRDATPVGSTGGRPVRFRTHWYLFTGKWPKRAVLTGPPFTNEVVGDEYVEWSHVSSDDAGWKIRLRVRFRSPHPDWAFSDGQIMIRLKDGTTQTIPLFSDS
jgi:hypothetical protein